MCGELNGDVRLGLLRNGRKAMHDRWLTTIAFFLLTLLALPAATDAGELWLVSTRGVCPSQCTDLAALDVWKLGSDQCWAPASVEEFLSTADPAVPITVFLHGNRADLARSVEMGWPVWSRLSSQAADRPFRLVIWSWPSDRIRGLRRDAEVKVWRSGEEAFLLARFLNRLRGDARLNLFGYSLGARIATGALELLAGGQISGRLLADRNPSPRTPMRAMLVAAAEDTDSLAPSECHGLALGALERALVAFNPCDRALRLYPRISCGAAAMGYSGPSCPAALGDCAKIEAANVSCWVGGEHNWENYFASPEVQARLAWYAFLADHPADASVATNP
jgi:hypothetical protein